MQRLKKIFIKKYLKIKFTKFTEVKYINFLTSFLCINALSLIIIKVLPLEAH